MTYCKLVRLQPDIELIEFLGRFQIFENRPLDPVLSLRVISEKKQICEQKFEKLSKE